MRGERHGFLAAGHDDGGVAVGDLLHADGDGAKPRAAELVEAPGGLFLRNAGGHRGLPGRVLALAGGEDLAEDDLVHLRAGSTLARSRAALMATAPSSWAGVLPKAPLKEPTAVRAAPTMTMLSSAMSISMLLELLGRNMILGAPV